jgi:hypothetical protein
MTNFSSLVMPAPRAELCVSLVALFFCLGTASHLFANRPAPEEKFDLVQRAVCASEVLRLKS